MITPCRFFEQVRWAVCFHRLHPGRCAAHRVFRPQHPRYAKVFHPAIPGFCG